MDGPRVNYNFCHNPKCSAHIEVSLKVLSSGRMEIMGGGKVKEVYRCKWLFDDRILWLCDSCTAAVNMVSTINKVDRCRTYGRGR